MTKRALVIGGSIEGVQAALDLGDCGIEVSLIEESSALHANTLNENAGGTTHLLFMPKLLAAAKHPNIRIFTNASVAELKGEKGNFKVTIVERPRRVNVDACASCGRCERECPVNIVGPDNRNGHRAIHRADPGVKSVPSAYAIETRGTAPCTAACPAGINAQGYVALVSKGRFAEALDLITESVPFPRVLGRVCNHPCEDNCTRGKIDQAVAICALKRFVANGPSDESFLRHDLDSGVKPNGPPRVAIIGSGPAGLTAARDLARMGHPSTVFEALPMPGGMITVGMPRFRLPREVRQADINDIVKLGIEIRTSTPIGDDLTLEDLKQQGYKATLIATGAHRNRKLGIPGEGLTGVIDSVAFLRALNLKQPVSVGSRVVVIGGGYTGIDSGRTAVRMGCTRVLIVERRSQGDMTTNPEEVVEARREGVEIEFLVAPVRIIGRAGKVVGVECVRMKPGGLDESGRGLVPVEGSEFVVEADTVVLAVGQRPDLSFLRGDTSLTEGRGHVIVDPRTQATKVPGIFAAGDVAGRPSTMIEAVAAGRRAAVSIDQFLRGEEVIYHRTKVTPVEVDIDEVFVPPIKRQPMPYLEHAARAGNFEEVELGFNREAAVTEAQRCLNCGGCSECLECVRACELNALNHNAVVNRFEMAAGAIIAVADAVSPLAPTGPGVYACPQHGGLAQASAAAARAMVDLAAGQRFGLRTYGVGREMNASDGALRDLARKSLEPRIGVYVCGCGGGISDVVDVSDVAAYCRGLDDVVHSGRIGYACTQEAADEIKNAIQEHHLTHVVLAACSCCGFDQICFSCSDRRVRCKSNLLGEGQPAARYEFVNIREHCAWVHRGDPQAATGKAKMLVKAGMGRVRLNQAPPEKMTPVERSVLVMGSSLSGMQAASLLSSLGFDTTVIADDDAEPDATGQYYLLKRHLESELRGNRATVLHGAKSVNLEGSAGRYQATALQDGRPLRLTAGAMVIDLSSVTGLPPLLLKDLARSRRSNPLAGIEPCVSRLPGVFVCGGEGTMDVAEALIQGAAAAGKATIWLHQDSLAPKPGVVTVDQVRCRGCGTCVSVCEYAAMVLAETRPGVVTSQVDEGLCRGCGMCAAHCPSGAIHQRDYSEESIAASLEAILL